MISYVIDTNTIRANIKDKVKYKTIVSIRSNKIAVPTV